ncbi:hypothetical protein [Pyrodictium occultum]|nr:hypothetical protein [Pyrodictium occultum]
MERPGGIMAIVERLEEAARSLEALASQIRRGIGPAESLIENRANTAISAIADTVDHIAEALRRLRCIAEARGAKDRVVPLCVTWRALEEDGGLVLVRVKPETVISLRGGRLVFHRGNTRLEAEGRRVRLCKLSYCKEFDPADRRQIVEELPQIFYLLRGISNNVRKTLESIIVCARREAPNCTRI